MRLFIAIEFDETVKDEIELVSQVLFESAESGRRSRKENLHLTLAFLGEQPRQKVPAIRRCMEKAQCGAFELEFARLGRFSQREGDVLWLGLGRSPELASLERSLRMALISEGFDLEDRAFKPHITLGREMKLRPDFDSGRVLIPKQTWWVRELVLMESTRERGRLVYLPHIRIPL